MCAAGFIARVSLRPHLLVAAALMAVAVPLRGDNGDAERVIENRIAGFRDIGSAFKNVGDELRSRQPDVAKIQDSLAVINGYAPYIVDWFPPGSEPPIREELGWIDTILSWFSSSSDGVLTSDVESHAKIEIWMRRAEFDASARRFVDAATRALTDGQRGDVDSLRGSFAVLGETCKACHDTFREEID